MLVYTGVYWYMPVYTTEHFAQGLTQGLLVCCLGFCLAPVYQDMYFFWKVMLKYIMLYTQIHEIK